MARKKVFKHNIKISDWLASKPYKQPTSYDSYYIKLANRVLRLLKKHHLWFFQRRIYDNHLKDLSVILISYFEDFINELGIWQVFTEHNLACCGYYLPFYDLSDYESDYINPQDIEYILWHWLINLYDDKFYIPHIHTFKILSQEVFDLFENYIEDAPATDFYQSYLRIFDDTNFFQLKEKLSWFIKGCYAPGKIEIAQNFIRDVLDASENMKLNVDLNSLGYGIQDDYIFIKRSAFSALSPLEWFSRVVDCSDNIREDILKLRKRIVGVFYYEGADENYWLFQESLTEKHIKVRRDSIEIPAEAQIPRHLHSLSLEQWRNEWWVSGITAYIGEKDEKFLNDRKSNISNIPFYIYSEEEQQQVWQTIANMESDFIEYFGERIIVFDNKEIARQNLNDYFEYNQQKAKQRSNIPEDEAEELQQEYQRNKKANSAQITDTFENFGKHKVALAFTPNEGVQLSTLIPKIIHQLSVSNLSKDAKKELFWDLMDEDLSPIITKELLNKYSNRNLEFPIKNSTGLMVDMQKELDFLMRFFKYESYGEQIPFLRAISSSS